MVEGEQMLFRSTLRRIRKTFGRFFAIFAIICLGVGFFVGLKVSKEAMVETAGNYFEELKLFDFRLVSTLGLTPGDVEQFAAEDYVDAAEGSVSADFMYIDSEGSDVVLHAHQLSDRINRLDLVSGRMPEAPDECVVDDLSFFNSMPGGDSLVLSGDNSDETMDTFAYDEYKIVGTVHSPYYINFERGSTSLGNGNVGGFVYMLPDGFSSDLYTEIFVRLADRKETYSEEYDEYADECAEKLTELLEKRAGERYDYLMEEALNGLKDAEKQLDEIWRLYGGNLELFPDVYAKYLEGREKVSQGYAEIDEKISEPNVFVLGRNTNFGYMSMQNDTDIINGIARVFPLFFFLVAALVCVTTMTRMVAEQRVENGVLKALGYSDGSIVGQYLFYAGSASVLGCFAGFLLGSKFMPMVLWEIYHIMYTVDRPIVYLLDWKLFGLCAIGYLVCAFGATGFACSGDLREAAAQLIRPKSPEAGKRILLERITFLWSRMKFLHKVSARNILRYKKRMFMMILGVGGCTALLLTGFGIRDSIQPIVDYQYEEIHVYDFEVTFLEPVGEKETAELRERCKDGTKDILFCHSESMNLVSSESSDSVTVVAADRIPEEFVNLHNGDEQYEYPQGDSVIIDYRLADANGIEIGDTIELNDDEYNILQLTVTGIFDNYIYDYAYISSETYEKQMKKTAGINTAYVNVRDGVDVHVAAAAYLDMDNTANISINADMRQRVGNMLESLDYVVLIVLVCAGTLAFIVIYNLTNISINERIREIATIKVLGFRSGESAAYVFRENLVLTIISAIVGLPMGVALHRYVMEQIKINAMYFGHRIMPASFGWAVVITFVFAVFVDFFMFFRLEKVNMAESLKAVD